jgi:hypothetical protein
MSLAFVSVDSCRVSGTDWDAVIPNKIFSCEGALIRRADVAFCFYLQDRHGDLSSLRQSHQPRAWIQRACLRSLPLRRKAA